jgi:hypothetical protein
MRRARKTLAAFALLAASAAAAAAPAAEAASAKRCKALAPKARVVVKGPASIVLVRGSSDDFNKTFLTCLYAKPRLYKIPGQDGGAAERFRRFKLAGRYVAYEHVNVEEASNFYPGYVELVDIRKRVRVYQHDAFPLTAQEQDAGAVTGVSQILLRADGAVAWIGHEENSQRRVVHTALRTQVNPVEVDNGADIAKSSLRRVAGDDDAFTWMRGGETKTAQFGGGAPSGG